jgi:hypothetical protein
MYALVPLSFYLAEQHILYILFVYHSHDYRYHCSHSYDLCHPWALLSINHCCAGVLISEDRNPRRENIRALSFFPSKVAGKPPTENHISYLTTHLEYYLDNGTTHWTLGPLG